MKKHVITIILLTITLAINAQNTIQPKVVYSSDFVIDEIPRNISFYIPANYGTKDFHPLVVMLHPEGESSVKFIKNYGDVIHPIADSLNYVILYPDALKGKWYSAVEANQKDSVNDVGFINIMITYFIQQYACNPNELFICGFDKGGDMAEKLACKLNIPVTAIASFKKENTNASACTPPSTVSVMDTKSFTPGTDKLPYKKAVDEAFSYFQSKIKK